MNNTLTFIFLLFFTLTKSQAQEAGYILSFDGNKEMIYQNQKKKIKLSRMSAGCDCELDGNKLRYLSEEGKVVKISQSKVKKLFLKKGRKFCRDAKKNTMGGNTFLYDLGAVVKDSLILYGLPLKKNGSRIMLQSVLYKSPDNIMTMYTKQDLTTEVNIYSVPEMNFLTGGYNYLSVGYSKRGKKALAEIKRYFKSCSELIAKLDNNVKKNKKLKRFQKSPILSNIYYIQCN